MARPPKTDFEIELADVADQPVAKPGAAEAETDELEVDIAALSSRGPGTYAPPEAPTAEEDDLDLSPGGSVPPSFGKSLQQNFQAARAPATPARPASAAAAPVARRPAAGAPSVQRAAPGLGARKPLEPSHPERPARPGLAGAAGPAASKPTPPAAPAVAAGRTPSVLDEVPDLEIPGLGSLGSAPPPPARTSVVPPSSDHSPSLAPLQLFGSMEAAGPAPAGSAPGVAARPAQAAGPRPGLASTPGTTAPRPGLASTPGTTAPRPGLASTPGTAASPAPPRAVVAASAPAGLEGYGSHEFDDEDADLETLPRLTLATEDDLSEVRPPLAAPPQAVQLGRESTDAFEDLLGGAQAQADLALLESRPNAVSVPPSQRQRGEAGDKWPTGVSPELGGLIIPFEQVRELAGYPKPPKSALGAPLYAWQVRQRRRALEIELAAARRRLEKAEIERDRQLALIAERQRNELQGDERFEALLARIRDMDNSVTARSEELTRLKGEYERKCEEHARRLQNAKQAFTGLLADEQKQRGVFERAKVDYERAAAKFKRATIEHRAALQRSEAAAKAGGGMAATTTGELSSLQQRIAETKPEMDRFQAEMLRTRDAHKASYERAKAGEENIARLEEERAALDRDYQRDRDAVTGRLANQQNSRNKALADVARMMLARKTAKLQSGELERLLVADREVKDASFAAEGLARGAETYDRDAFNRGKLLGLSAVGLLFVVVALGLVMALRSRPAASTDAPAGAPTLEGLKPWKPSDYKD